MAEATAAGAFPESAFVDVLARAVEALATGDIPYVLVGGIASTVCGRERWTEDIDVLVREVDAERALAALAEHGFATERTNPAWIFKATRGDVVVDVIFWSKGNIVLDDEMLERAAEADFRGVRVQVVAPEDLVVMKAIAHDEQSPRHWADALGILAACRLDWDYLERRARFGPRRVLSLLVYAESNDLAVPAEVVRGLFDLVYPEERA
jgi:predicted nucleotidyltransferase